MAKKIIIRVDERKVFGYEIPSQKCSGLADMVIVNNNLVSVYYNGTHMCSIIIKEKENSIYTAGEKGYLLRTDIQKRSCSEVGGDMVTFRLK